jgi:hypothetical protein
MWYCMIKRKKEMRVKYTSNFDLKIMNTKKNPNEKFPDHVTIN